MPKNAKKGKNAKSKASIISKREFITRTEDQLYAKVNRMLGDHRVECELADGTTRLGIIRASMRRGGRNNGNRINVNDIVLVSTRDFQEDKVDIIHVYKTEEIEELLRIGERIPLTGENQENFIVFGDDSNSEDDLDISQI